MGTYVVSDLHGQYDIFEKVLEKIQFSENDFLYVLGDAIDRGSESIKILLKIMDSDNMDLLIGNHEFMMLNSVDLDGGIEAFPGKDARLWLYSNGGYETFEKYKMLSGEERQKLLEYLSTRKLTTLVMAGGQTFCLTHSNFDKNHIGDRFIDINYEDVWRIVWETPYRQDLFIPVSRYEENSWHFVIGHVPVQRITGEYIPKAYNEANITVIDGGMSFLGKGLLSGGECGIICLRLDDMSEIVATS